MAEELKAVIYDASTEEVIERPLTSDELADLKAIDNSSKADKSAQEAAKASALAKLAALGLTEEEIAAL
jgi:hypothetical protein